MKVLINIFIFTLSTYSAYLIWNNWSGKYEGDRLERSLRFSVGKYFIHLHHWLLATIILILLLVLHKIQPIIIGALVGSILQGLGYRDRFVIYYRKDKFTEIYNKFKNKKLN